ncbi:MAG: DUF1146 domain-containing protein [Firmicutes bacterium]|nr:DUF1146 domain-containing protein [Bacillota bacterium]
MTIKTLLYIICVPLSIFALDSINITNKFKKNKELQAKLLYLMISLALSYLVVNFFYDFFLNSMFIQ